MMHLITVVIAIVLMAVLGSTARADVEIRVSNTTESTQITTGSATVTNNDESTATAFDPPPEGTASGSVIGVVSEPPSEESQSETQDEDQAREQSETQDEDQAREQSEGFSSGTRVSEHINV